MEFTTTTAAKNSCPNGAADDDEAGTGRRATDGDDAAARRRATDDDDAAARRRAADDDDAAARRREGQPVGGYVSSKVLWQDAKVESDALKRKRKDATHDLVKSRSDGRKRVY